MDAQRLPHAPVIIQVRAGARSYEATSCCRRDRCLGRDGSAIPSACIRTTANEESTCADRNQVWFSVVMMDGS